MSECKVSLGNTKVLQANAKFFGGCECFVSECSVSIENKRFGNECSVIQGNANILGKNSKDSNGSTNVLRANTKLLENAKVLGENAKVYGGMWRICKWMQCFYLKKTQTIWEQIQSYLGEPKMQSYTG